MIVKRNWKSNWLLLIWSFHFPKWLEKGRIKHFHYLCQQTVYKVYCLIHFYNAFYVSILSAFYNCSRPRCSVMFPQWTFIVHDMSECLHVAWLFVYKTASVKADVARELQNHLLNRIRASNHPQYIRGYTHTHRKSVLTRKSLDRNISSVGLSLYLQTFWKTNLSSCFLSLIYQQISRSCVCGRRSSRSWV